MAPRVQELLKRGSHGGHVFVFRGRRGHPLKLLWANGQGVCLFAKRLERGRSIWPSPADGVVTVSAARLGYLREWWRDAPGTDDHLASAEEIEVVDETHPSFGRGYGGIWVTRVRSRQPAYRGG